MTERVSVYTDGSCLHEWTDQQRKTRGSRGAGGWAAHLLGPRLDVLVYGSVADTTNTRMEMLAIAEAFDRLSAGVVVDCHVDCTVALSIFDRWQRKQFPAGRKAPERLVDYDLWERIRDHLDRLEVRFHFLARGERPSRHRLVHDAAFIAAAQLEGRLGPGHVRGCLRLCGAGEIVRLTPEEVEAATRERDLAALRRASPSRV